MSLVRSLCWLVPGVSDAQMAERIDRSFSIVPNAHVRRGDVPVELYASGEDLLEACVRARAGVHVQRHNAGPAIQCVLERISRPSYEPNPLVFDGVLFRYWSIPVAYLENAAAPRAGCTVVFELNLVAELERRRATESVRAPTAAAAGDVLARMCRAAAWSAAVAVYALMVYKASGLRCG
jgi:hypothetical protein